MSEQTRADEEPRTLAGRLQAVKDLASAHHEGQPAHLLLHALQVDIPWALDAIIFDLTRPGAALASPQGDDARERIAREVWASEAYPGQRDHPLTQRIWEDVSENPQPNASVRRAFATADRILRLLSRPLEEAR